MESWESISWRTPVDNLWTTRRQSRSNPVDNSPMIDGYLTKAVRSIAFSERPRACCSRVRLHLTPGFCLLLGVLAINMQPVHASQADQYKLYAHSRIVNDKQYQCFQAIINKENRSWHVDARNGSHFGLGQMRSKHYRNLDGYRQIDATLAYIKVRYKTICNAWLFHKKHGYY